MFLTPNVEALYRRRTEQGLDMKALSTKSGLPSNAILRLEKGESSKTNHLRAQAIADALGCRVEDIFIIPSCSGQKAAANNSERKSP